jgi:predicted TIM-barrel fold metal-dependent hydrolase
MKRLSLVFLACSIAVYSFAIDPTSHRPVIDVHPHAGPKDWTGHPYLKKLIDHGFAKRIMFGSDDFPMAESINSIESFDFLTEEQKSDILCANAARLFRLEVDSVCKPK